MKIGLKENILIYFGSIIIEVTPDMIQHWEWNEGSRRVFIDLKVNNLTNVYFDLATNSLKYRTNGSLPISMRNALKVLESELKTKLIVDK